MRQLTIFDFLPQQITPKSKKYISPCPYIEDCLNYPVGCKGGCWWCERVPDRGEKLHFKEVTQ